MTPDEPNLQPGKDNPASDEELGYGYQWWIPEGDGGEFLVIGVYNQFTYVNPAHGVVIVKLSSNRNYSESDEESCYREILILSGLLFTILYLIDFERLLLLFHWFGREIFITSGEMLRKYDAEIVFWT